MEPAQRRTADLRTQRSCVWTRPWAVVTWTPLASRPGSQAPPTPPKGHTERLKHLGVGSLEPRLPRMTRGLREGGHFSLTGETAVF